MGSFKQAHPDHAGEVHRKPLLVTGDDGTPAVAVRGDDQHAEEGVFPRRADEFGRGRGRRGGRLGSTWPILRRRRRVNLANARHGKQVARFHEPADRSQGRAANANDNAVRVRFLAANDGSDGAEIGGKQQTGQSANLVRRPLDFLPYERRSEAGRAVELAGFELVHTVFHFEREEVGLHTGENAGRLGRERRPAVFIECGPDRFPLLDWDGREIERLDGAERTDKRLKGRLHFAENLIAKSVGEKRVRFGLEYHLPAISVAHFRINGNGSGWRGGG